MKKLKIISKLFFCILLLNLFGGCETEFPWKAKSKALNELVIDAIITNEMKPQVVNASLTNENMNNPYTPVSGLIISITDSLHVYTFTESNIKPGSYYSGPFQAVVGKTYFLTVSNQSDVYTAQAVMVPVTAMDTFLLQKDNATGLFQYVPVFGNEPTMLEVFMDWSTIPSYCSTYGHCQAQETFYMLKNIDVNKVFSPDKEVISFPSGTRIVRRKYSLSQEHQDFLRSLLMETTWRGGLFDVQPGNVKSNMSNGALGYFGACMVVSDSLLVK